MTLLFPATREMPAEYLDRTNEVERELEDRAEQEVMRCDKSVRAYILDAMDEDMANKIAALVAFALKEGDPKSYEVACDFETDYKSYRVSTANSVERLAIEQTLECGDE